MRDEEIRRSRKAAAEAAKYAHPFDRSRTYDDTQTVFDDGRTAPAVLVTFGGGGDKLKVAPVDFFDLMGDLPVRRLFLRKLSLAGTVPHDLGDSVAALAKSLANTIAAHDRKIFLGVSLGGFNAMLLGTLLGVDRVIVVDPTTTLKPSVLEAVGDERGGGAEADLPPDWVAEFGDLPTVWERHPPPPVVLHYPYRDPVLRGHAEHIAHLPHVRPVPHLEHMPMYKICGNGSLQRWLTGALGLEGGPDPDLVWS